MFVIPLAEFERLEPVEDAANGSVVVDLNSDGGGYVLVGDDLGRIFRVWGHG